jgi:hypothetical protein
MKTLSIILISIVAMSILVIAGPVSATSISECQALIGELQGTLADDVVLGGNHPDRTLTGLQSKLDGASIKLDEVKISDAIKKLNQFGQKIVDMRDASKAKISDDDAALLIDGNDDVLDCIDGLNGD